MRCRAFLALSSERYQSLFSADDQMRLEKLVVFGKSSRPYKGWETMDADWENVEVLISGWGTPAVPAEVFCAAKSLRLIAHAGATRALFGALHAAPQPVELALASSALGRCVAEYAFSLMNLASKRAFWMERRVREGGWREPSCFFGGCFELYRAKVGLIGGGETARQLIRMLKPLECDISVYDPYIDRALIEAEGARCVETLEEIFSQCRVVSLHAVHNSQTEGMIRKEHFALLPEGALFINTARGPIVRETELAEELKKERFVACLDVAAEEPPTAEHPFRHLPNVVLTPHIAGAIAENRMRMGKAAVDAVEAYVAQRREVAAVQREGVPVCC